MSPEPGRRHERDAGGGQRADRAEGERLATAARDGSRTALARLLTAVEERSGVAEPALRLLFRSAAAAHVVGITGPPGSGKSTLVAAIVGEARSRERSVAVLAIDPSSPVTGGAILGDRVRMQAFAGDDGVFIRSMAARGHLGGLAGTTAQAAAVLGGCGFALVLVETVGTGQSEVEVASIADTTLVVQAPGAGDEVQALKAGLLEVADIVVVSKADRPDADRTAAALRAMLTVSAADDRAAGDRPRPKRPPVLVASGLEGTGVAEILDALDRAHARREEAPAREAARLARARTLVEAIIAERLRATLDRGAQGERTSAIVAEVAAHALDPYAAADRLLADLRTDRGDEPPPKG